MSQTLVVPRQSHGPGPRRVALSIGLVGALLSAALAVVAQAAPALADTGGYPYTGATCQDTTHVSNGVEFCEGDNWVYNSSLWDQQYGGYGYRNCTDWVAYRLATNNGYAMPHAIGDASAWGSYFSAHGSAPNNTPAVGAIAWESGGDHVAYVEAVNGSQVTISEYNEHYYPGEPTWGSGLYDTRTVSASTFEYIHVKDISGGGGGVSDGSFVSHDGFVYRMAGGAPLYVSNWNNVGGSQPTTALSDAQFAQLRQFPADGTLVSTQGGYVYRFAGGAPLYVASWGDVGGSQPTITVDQVALDQGGNSAEPWDHVRQYPANGTFVNTQLGYVYRFAGGAALYVSSWSDVGGSQPSTRVSQAALDQGGNTATPYGHVARYPSDGTFVGTSAGYVYEFAGGAALYVSSWNHVGGPQSAMGISQSVIDQGGNTAEPWGHVAAYPSNGTVLNGQGMSHSFLVTGGIARPVIAKTGIAIDYADLVNAGLAKPWNHLRSSTPHARLAKLPSKTAKARVKVRWPLLDTASATSTYTLRWRDANTRGWHSPKAWRGVKEGPVKLTDLEMRHRYCFDIRATDNAGIVGPWSAQRCVLRTR